MLQKINLLSVTGLVALLGFALCSVAYGQEPAAQDQISDISTRPLGDLTVSKTRRIPAVVVSDNDTMLKAEISAVVDELLVKPGQSVAADETLLRFDCRDHLDSQALAKAELAAADADLRYRQLQHKRIETLQSQALNAEQELDASQTQLASRRAARQQASIRLRQAERDVERCTIKAPFAGVVMAKQVSKGELLNRGDTVLRLVDTSSLELSASLAPSYRAELNDTRHYEFDGYPVALSRLATAIDTNSRSLEARFSFSAEQPLSGASGKLSWTTEQRFLPSRYVVDYRGERGIFLLEAGKIRFHALPGSAPGRPSYVDLPATARLVVGRQASLEDGQSVAQ